MTADDDWNDEIDRRFARRWTGADGSRTEGGAAGTLPQQDQHRAGVGAATDTINEPPRAEDVDDEQRVLPPCSAVLITHTDRC